MNQDSAIRYAFWTLFRRAPARAWMVLAALALHCVRIDAAALPQKSEFLIQHWQTEDGLPQNSVTSIAQGLDGYLWLGTFNGLVRFDGHRFVVFDPANEQALKSSRIVQVSHTGGGSIWVNSEFQDTAVFSNGRFSELLGPDKAPVPGVNKVIVDPQQRIFLSDTNRAILRYEQGRIERLHQFDADVGRGVWFAATKDGVWVAMKRVFGLLTASGFVEIEQQSPERVLVEVVEPTRDGEGVWVAGRDSGLRRYSQGRWTDQHALPVDRLVPTCLFEDEQRRVWVGTLTHGIFIRDGEKWSQLSTSNGLSHDSIRCIFEDQEGNYWVGTDGGGLNRLRPRFIEVIDSDHGLPTEVVLALAPDSKDRLWVGLNAHSIGILDRDVFKPIDAPAWADVMGSIWSMFPCEDGALWLGDGHGGLVCLHEDGRGYRLPNPEISRRVYAKAMNRSSDGTLYVGDVSGLVAMKDGAFTDLSTASGLANDDVRAIAFDEAGQLVIGTNGRGLARMENGAFVFYDKRHGLKDNRVWSLFVDSQHDVWVGTFGSGLSRFADGKFQDLSGPRGVPVKVVTSILEDDLGSLWIGSMQGIFQVSRDDLVRFGEGKLSAISYRRFDRTDGLKSTECSGGFQPAACKLSDGRICIATIKGIVRIDPREIRPNQVAARVLVEEVLVNDRNIGALSSTPVFAPGTERIEIRYTGISFAGPEKVRFRYRLQGSDVEWVDVGNRRVAYYSHLRPGTYSFKVQACNSDGDWNESGAILGFVIKPFFWQTSWFLLTVAVLVLGSGAWWVRHISLKRVRQRLEVVEQQHAFERERSRIARDIHDDVGARLTQIGLMAELGRRATGPIDAQQSLERIAAETRDVVQAMDEIVWAVDPEKDKLENIADYLAAFTQEFLQFSSVQCRLDIPESLPAVVVAAEVRHNIVMILKEALNNVVKHSEAQHAWVRMALEDANLRFEVEDDGVGMSAAGVEALSAGNGLRNMEARASQIDGSVVVTNRPGGGTCVRLTVPLADLSSTGPRQKADGSSRSA